MTALVANFVGMTVSGTPGTGLITLGSSIPPGSISFALAYGQDTEVDLTYIDGANKACETGCMYNHASNTITRGYNETSTTGSVLNLTSNALVFVGWPASKVNAFNQMVVNVGTNEIPIWELQATIIPRTDTIANLSSLVSGGGELCSATDINSIVQLQGTPGSGTVAYYCPMYPGTYEESSNGRTTSLKPAYPLISTTFQHDFQILSPDQAFSGAAGKLTLRGGYNTVGTGGSVEVWPGGAPTTKYAGSFTVGARSGDGVGGKGSFVTVNAGAGTNSAAGGAVSISSGASTGGTAGNVTISAGDGSSNGIGGDIVLNAGQGLTGATAGKIILKANNTTLLTVGIGSQIGFFGSEGVTKPTISGNHTDGSALLNLLSSLNSLGLISNASTAVSYVLSAISPKLLTFGQPQLQPIPTVTIPYKITGNTRYVDPNVVGPGTGTFADPYKSPASAVLAAGDGLLFKAGTTTTITAAIGPSANGTSVAPIIYGVYDGAASGVTDKRIYGRQGMATITCAGAAIKAFLVSSKDYIAIDGLAVTNNSGANALISVTGTSANCQITNNAATAGASDHYLIAGGLNNVVEGNSSVGAAGCGINYQVAANDSNIKINFNYVSGYAANQRGILIYDGAYTTPFTSYSVGGVIACNTVVNQTTPISAGGIGGISLMAGDNALKVFRNTINNCAAGIIAFSSKSPGGVPSSASADMTGLLIQNNDISNCEFNITLGMCFGQWLIEYNRLVDAGALSSGAAVTTSKFGRNIELFGWSEVLAVKDGIVRFNYCTGAYNWNAPASTEGSEGIGIGLDNNTRNVKVYGNICVSNEGSGIQINSGWSNFVFGNLCIDNFHFRAGRTTVPREMDSAQIAYVKTPAIMIFNNTCVSLGETHQKYGISESYSGNPSTGGIVFNNLSIGASVSGIRLDNTGVSATENHNIVINSPAVVLDISGAATTPGTGTASSTEVITSEWYRPAVNGICDGTGVVAPGWALSLDGTLLSSKTPIGALHPQ